MRRTLEFETLDDASSFLDPFDNPPAGQYRIELFPDAAEDSDKVVLIVDREACRSFAKIFAQLAEGPYEQGHHLHVGPDERDHYRRYMRIVRDDESVKR
ncbi:MAG: hypothetical protein ACYTAS_01795 [Planctomycetota bacterium]|jgi:hypothetical protein